MKKTLLTPLRYPGGKSKAIKKLERYFPSEIKEIRDPMTGGGSIPLYLKMNNPKANLWINDKYYNLYCFWKSLRDDSVRLIETLKSIKTNMNESEEKHRILFLETKEKINKVEDEFEKAVCFFILNKCSFSGLTETGTFSKMASESNFSLSSIERLLPISKLLEGAKITNLDYDILLKEKGENVFIFLDPPYDILQGKNKQSNALYGKNGVLHKQFDHELFYENVCDCKHRFMITYNCSDYLFNKYSEQFNCIKWNLMYTMRQTKNNNEELKGKLKEELLVLNY
jgi:DNA adenine methylase